MVRGKKEWRRVEKGEVKGGVRWREIVEMRVEWYRKW